MKTIANFILIIVLGIVLALAIFAAVTFRAGAQEFPVFCNYPGAASFEVTCRLDMVSTNGLTCGGVEYWYAPERFCQPATYLDPAVHEGDMVRLSGDVIAGAGGSYGPLGQWQAGDVVVWRIDAAHVGRLPFSTWR